MNSLGGDESMKKELEMIIFTRKFIKDRDKKMDVLDWLLLGKHFSSINEDEVAF